MCKKYSKLSLSSLNKSRDSLQLSFLQYMLALFARQEMKWTQPNFSPLAKRSGSFSRPVFLAYEWMSGCIWYLRELGCSMSDFLFKERIILIGQIPGIEHAFITASAATELNEPWKVDIRTKASLSASVRRSKDVFIAFSTDPWSSSRTASGSLSRFLMSVSSAKSESRDPTMHSARGTQPHNLTSCSALQSSCWTSCL